MENGKGPHVAGFAFTVAVSLGGAHAGIAGEIIGNEVVRLQPVRETRRLIAIWRGIFAHRLFRDVFQPVLVEGQELFKILRRVGFDGSGKVVMNPAAMASNRGAEAYELA